MTMKHQLDTREAASAPAARSYVLPVTEGSGIPHDDAEGINEELIRSVVI
jgi:hypothetical protein